MKKYQSIPTIVYAQQMTMQNINQSKKVWEKYGNLTFYRDGWLAFSPRGHASLHFRIGDYLVLVNGQIHAMDETDFKRLYEEIPNESR